MKLASILVGCAALAAHLRLVAGDFDGAVAPHIEATDDALELVPGEGRVARVRGATLLIDSGTGTELDVAAAIARLTSDAERAADGLAATLGDVREASRLSNAAAAANFTQLRGELSASRAEVAGLKQQLALQVGMPRGPPAAQLRLLPAPRGSGARGWGIRRGEYSRLPRENSIQPQTHARATCFPAAHGCARADCSPSPTFHTASVRCAAPVAGGHCRAI